MGADEYHPVSMQGSNLTEAGGIGYMVVDALDTMQIMGLHDEYSRARHWVETKLDFDRDGIYNVFEVRTSTSHYGYHPRKVTHLTGCRQLSVFLVAFSLLITSPTKIKSTFRKPKISPTAFSQHLRLHQAFPELTSIFILMRQLRTPIFLDWYAHPRSQRCNWS